MTLSGVIRGTTLFGLSGLARSLEARGVPAQDLTAKIFSPSGRDMLAGSDFINRLIEGGVEVPGVRYVAISTIHEESANPLSTTRFQGPNTQNIVLQDGCSKDRTDHTAIIYSPRAVALTVNALGRNIDVPCTSVVGPFHADVPEVPGSSELPSVAELPSPEPLSTF